MSDKCFIAAKLHGLHITECNIDYHGSITLDPTWLSLSGIEPYEQVHVLNCDNGARLVTYAIPGILGHKECGLNGAAARLCSVGQKILVLTYKYCESFEGAKVLTFDEQNAVTDMLEYNP